MDAKQGLLYKNKCLEQTYTNTHTHTHIYIQWWDSVGSRQFCKSQFFEYQELDKPVVINVNLVFDGLYSSREPDMLLGRDPVIENRISQKGKMGQLVPEDIYVN